MFNLQKCVSLLSRTAYRTSVSFSSSAAPIITNRVAPTTTTATNKNNNDDDKQRSKNPMVAAAFDSLLSADEIASTKTSTVGNVKATLSSSDEKNNNVTTKPDELDDRIINAKTVMSLLSLTEGNNNISRKHALKIVSILAEWSSINRVQLSDFENDARFIKLCRTLGRAVPKQQQQQQQQQQQNQQNGGGSINHNHNNNVRIGNGMSGLRTDDLNTVIGVAGDDEAAKLIASISVPQMIKVMSALAQKKRRSTPLLRSLAYNISSNSSELDLKQCADLLYAMAVLNFPDAVLIGRISTDIQSGLTRNLDKPAAVGSIITSLGLLKYRDADLLESLIDWVLQHSDICRPPDVSSLFMTLATLNYPSTKADKIQKTLSSSLVEQDFAKSIDWLNNVWALVILNMANTKQIESVLKKEFIEKMIIDRGADLLPNIKMKLLNIDAAAGSLYKDYNGERLVDGSLIFDVPLAYTKNKQILINGLLDTLKSLFPSEAYVRPNCKTKMGFVIDAECVLDSKLNPLAVNETHKNAHRLAIMVLDFYDMCQGVHQQPTGVSALAIKLLEQNGYKVLTVPYNEFTTSEKLLKRVQYLEGKLKRIVTTKN